MTKFLTKKLKNLPKLSKPVLIEGLPGIGNVARLSVDYLIDKLGAEKFMELYSDSFPNSVTINDDSLIEMFKIELFHVRVGTQDLLLISGDVQPTNDADSYALCNKIIKVALKHEVKELITIGGIGLPEKPDSPKVHAVFNDESLKESFNNVVVDGCDTVKVILGATGLLLGLAGLEGIKASSLLVETINDPSHVGIIESKEVLKVLNDYLKLALDFSDLDEEVKDYQESLTKQKIITKYKEEKQSYIG